MVRLLFYIKIKYCSHSACKANPEEKQYLMLYLEFLLVFLVNECTINDESKKHHENVLKTCLFGQTTKP